MDLEIIQTLSQPADTKAIMLVLDGLGGLPFNSVGLTALEAADTPNMDELAGEGICGLHVPIRNGITPGSGPSHLGLFGYDPIQYKVGRGVLSALGIGFDLRPDDVAARGNFCTLDQHGNVVDRRAGRISTETNKELLSSLEKIDLEGVEVFLRTVKEYRFLLVLRGEGLSGNLEDVDPQETGVPPDEPRALDAGAEKTSTLVRDFLEQARSTLEDKHPANMVLLRGFSQQPNWPDFQKIYGVRAAAIASYPMYRGVAKLVGMHALDMAQSVDQEFEILETEWDNFDFFFIHIKKTDSYGEDGDFDKKVELISEIDAQIPRIMELNPDVVMVTGDHSTPTVLKAHSWHPVPVLIWSRYCQPDPVEKFGERYCLRGGLGPSIPSYQLMPLMQANALRLKKFGA